MLYILASVIFRSVFTLKMLRLAAGKKGGPPCVMPMYVEPFIANPIHVAGSLILIDFRNQNRNLKPDNGHFFH